MNNIQYNIRANPDSFPVAHSNWYPPVAVLEKNQQYAQILMADLASTASEMTTVHQYLYQSWTINDHHQNIRRVIQRIAVVEQHHFSIIGPSWRPARMPFIQAQFLLVREYGKLQL